MANQELLLLQPVDSIGNEGDQVSVKAGFARNYLLPRGLAVPVTRANKKQIEALQKRAEVRLMVLLDSAKELAAKLEKISIAFAVKTGPGGKMFGSVTIADIVSRIAEEGVELDKKQVQTAGPVKILGRHTAKIKLHPEVLVELSFEVVSENAIEEVEEVSEASAEQAPAKA